MKVNRPEVSHNGKRKRRICSRKDGEGVLWRDLVTHCHLSITPLLDAERKKYRGYTRINRVHRVHLTGFRRHKDKRLDSTG